MAPYNLESEVRTRIKRGPFGLLKKHVVTKAPAGRIEEGGNMEIHDSQGVRLGRASVNPNGELSVKPEGDVLIDFGHIIDFEASVVLINGEKRSVGSINTSERELTLKTRDGSHKVNFRKE